MNLRAIYDGYHASAESIPKPESEKPKPVKREKQVKKGD
jgi:hypothetical protein